MTLADPAQSLHDQAQSFADELADLLAGVLPNAPGVEAVGHEDRYVIRTIPSEDEGLTALQSRGAPLFVNGERLATLTISIQCCLDSRSTWLAVHASHFVLHADLDRTPVLRFDYQREMHTAPHAHIQVHAHRGALSHLLSRSGHASPHDMASLHIPVGGSRLRPCLEDLLQFLIVECGFDSLPGWQQHVEAGRALWRRRQVASLVRDLPGEAARVLTDLGYQVALPAQGHPADSDKALHVW